jgi:alkyl sulfatase BDS1-like metallo-beta-lactamase superfamily hydrolase
MHASGPFSADPQPADEHTRLVHAEAVATMPLGDPVDLQLATRGRIAPLPDTPVLTQSGWPTWDRQSFVRPDPTMAGIEAHTGCPDTVHPSLWRQAGLNAVDGLFEVTNRVWQVRGIDLSNITFVAGDTGWIVVDTGSCAETAAAALELANEHLGARPVSAVIITHSHIDHFGGIRGVVDPEDVLAGRVPVLAPAGFLEAAASENVIAGNAMSRRAMYMYGLLLPRTERGHIDCGLGRGAPILGTYGLLAPTLEVHHTGEEHVLDGVRVEFQLTPGAEAPAEMNFLFPDLGALCMAENCTGTLHNVYTPRGAVVRDALVWSLYIDEAIERFAGRADVAFATHHWPHWDDVADGWTGWLRVQRDAYRYIHDQTMRLANAGWSPDEIAEELVLPEPLARHFHVHDYYGTVRHNAKAVYQRYLGHFDGNPATLNPHPRTERAKRYVEWMGGADTMVVRAGEALANGDARWVAEVINHLVFAEPDNRDARLLQAAALEQLGYRSESGVWRAFYLTGAQELRNGTPAGAGRGIVNTDMVAAMTPSMVFMWFGVHVVGAEAVAVGDLAITIDLTGDSAGEDPVWEIGLSNGAFYATPGRPAKSPVAVVRCTRHALTELILATGTSAVGDLLESNAFDISGDLAGVHALVGTLAPTSLWFPLIEPHTT